MARIKFRKCIGKEFLKSLESDFITVEELDDLIFESDIADAIKSLTKNANFIEKVKEMEDKGFGRYLVDYDSENLQLRITFTETK